MDAVTAIVAAAALVRTAAVAGVAVAGVAVTRVIVAGAALALAAAVLQSRGETAGAVVRGEEHLLGASVEVAQVNGGAQRRGLAVVDVHREDEPATVGRQGADAAAAQIEQVGGQQVFFTQVEQVADLVLAGGVIEGREPGGPVDLDVDAGHLEAAALRLVRALAPARGMVQSSEQSSWAQRLALDLLAVDRPVAAARNATHKLAELLAVIADEVFDPGCKNMDLAVDDAGRIYVVDTALLSIRVFEVEPTGGTDER